jgi:hypothetical protein
MAALPAAAAGPAVDLGGADSYAVLGSVSITNKGSTTITGDLGLSPGDSSSITGATGITLNGSTHAADSLALQARNGLGAAFTAAKGLDGTPVAQPDLGGLILTPGVYSSAISLAITGVLILDGGGDPTATWVFQAGSSLTTASNSTVVLIGGANSCNVFWQIGSSATLGTGSSFTGTVMADQSITATSGVTVQGRLLASNGSVTLDSDDITAPTNCAASGGGNTGGSGGSGGTGGSGGSGGTGSSGGSGASGASVGSAASVGSGGTRGTNASVPTAASGTAANDLAFTGANPAPLAVSGIALVALGVGAVALGMHARARDGRRRHRAH